MPTPLLTEGARMPGNVELKEHVLAIMDERMRYTESRLVAIEKAVSVANEVTSKSFASVNEFRGALADTLEAMKKAQEQFINRREYIDTFEMLRGQIADLQESRAELRGKASQEDVNRVRESAGQARLLAIIGTASGVLFGIVAIIMSFIK